MPVENCKVSQRREGRKERRVSGKVLKVHTEHNLTINMYRYVPVMAIRDEENLNKLPIHTVFHNNFFLLRTEVVINGQYAEVGSNRKGWLTLNSCNPKVAVTFDSLVNDVNEVLQGNGMEGVTNYWCEEVPLFEVKVSSKGDLKRLLHFRDKLKERLASKIATRMTAQLQAPNHSAPPPSLHVQVQSQVYLLIPDSQRKDGRIIEVTKDNIEPCMNLCMHEDNAVFDFAALFKRFHENPSREDKGINTLVYCLCYNYCINTGPRNFLELENELCEVVDWHHLGVHLKVPCHRLKIFERNYPHNTERCRTETLDWWMNNTVVKTWAAVVQALVKIGQRVQAYEIANKYGTSSTFSLPFLSRPPS